MIQLLMNDLDRTFASLADPTRRQVVELLGRGPRRASELADETGSARTAMSNHLKVLRDVGMVEVELLEHDARARVYHLRRDRLVALGAWVDQMQAFWSEQLGSFAQHAETRSKKRPG
jgi:DNA-binding transcriptional ArsR family regulator